MGVLLLVQFMAQAQTVVDFGKSYVNITKGTTGGTIEPGDTLQIRATFVVKAGTADSCAYYDTIPAGTTYIPGTLAILTNEGKIYKSFSDAYGPIGPANDDGWISGNNIQMNLGFGAAKIATQYRRGEVKSAYKPSFFGGACILVASYEVVVTAGYLTKISVGGGSISYSTAPPTVLIHNFSKDSIMVFPNYGICSNTVGTNAILSEFGGTFGSGKLKDRAASSNVPVNYVYTPFSSTLGMPNDYFYGVSNNTSGGTTGATGFSILNTWAFPDNSQVPSHRIFSVWDIIGDHTGAASPLLGNLPTNDTLGNTGGYMVVINSAYRTDTAFLDTITNLCPNTYYQYTAWIRNICSKCGCDSNGHGAGVSVPKYIATDSLTGDSSGVHPNLTFNINGFDYYTTGNILHTGQWIQKGFTYLTGPNQSSMTIFIRNNAPGGGGNDWAIDDIGVASCSPSMVLTPNRPDTLCYGADDTVRFKVSSFFNNYTHWLLQKSTDGGGTWTTTGIDTTGAAPNGTAIAVYNPVSSQYEYTISRYFRLNNTDTMTKYRIDVATTDSNLSNANCSFAATNVKIIRAINCQITLATHLLSFNGKVNNGLANLHWVSGGETAGTVYGVERSDDGIHFQSIGTVKGTAVPGSGADYGFIDPKALDGPAYYRINISDGIYNKYSAIVLLSSSDIGFAVKSLVNPFTSEILFDMTTSAEGIASLTLVDSYGRIVKQQTLIASQGLNSVRIDGLDYLQSGVYFLQVKYGEQVVDKRVVKLNP